ncbi:MAG TPA: beta-galactosidase [Chloroflexia bacterium]|nr:beta-galactosidase [Chloroflexia bacterium]
MTNELNVPLVGVDYYPEHWPEERWAQDARLMREAGLKLVRIGEFAWSRLEPQAGYYDFEWLDRAIETLASENLKVIIGTPSATPPAWMVAAHPEMLPVDINGRTYGFGGRRHYCPSSPYYREQSVRMASLEAAHYARNPAVVGWQVDNEQGNHGTTRCYCACCHTGFQNWLKQRYGTLEKLNEAMGTVFWSQEYSAWEQIPLPGFAPTNHNPSLELNFFRYASASAVEFSNLQVAAIREYFPAERGFITTNIFPQDDHINFYDLSRELDFISWDNYPHGTTGPAHVTFHHDWIWGFKRLPAWVMEQQLGPINWTKYNPPVPPGQARSWSAHNAAKSAGATVYFRWRESRFGQEQYHSAFLRHDARPTRAYRELQETHQELENLPADYWQRGPARVALLFSYDDMWALQLEPNNEAFNYNELVRNIHASLLARHIPCDVLPRGTQLEVLSDYALVLVPAPLLIDEAENQVWQEYVKSGGKLLLTMRAGVKSQSNVWTDQTLPGGMSEFLGARVEESLSFPPPGAGADEAEPRWGWREWTSQPVALSLPGGKQAQARRLWLETLSTEAGTESLAAFDRADWDDYFAGMPALLRRKQGQGEIYYLACWPEESFYSYLWQEVFAEEAAPVDSRWPPVDGLEVVASGANGQYITLFNHTSQPLKVEPPDGYVSLQGRLHGELPPHAVWFFKRAG